MRKKLSLALVFVSTTATASSLAVKDNSDVALTLATGNYNRLVVKNDKIMEAVFPPNSMAIKRDEQDGSVYVMLSATNPFTLFLTTEAGHHFSLHLTAEEALGKTIELVPQHAIPAKTMANKTQVKPKTMAEAAVPGAILALLKAMENHKPFADVRVKRQYGKALRHSQGLTLLPKESWDGHFLKGEAIELYNGGKASLTLSQAWFATESTLAIKLSKSTLNPHEHGMLYRVQGVSHG
jgi:conjugal transfer pilus assembly protein TraK